MLYFDGVHLASPDLAALHRWIRAHGIPVCWFHRHPTHPHYDLRAKWAPKALNDPAVLKVSSRELVRQCYRGTNGH